MLRKNKVSGLFRFNLIRDTGKLLISEEAQSAQSELSHATANSRHLFSLRSSEPSADVCLWFLGKNNQ